MPESDAGSVIMSLSSFKQKLCTPRVSYIGWFVIENCGEGGGAGGGGGGGEKDGKVI